MYWSRTLIPTQKHAPSDAVTVSHRLMIRAGLIRQLGSGIFDFLPLGVRSLQKAQRIVREEMEALGAIEVLLPALQPAELWQRSGRDRTFGQNLFRVDDRHGRSLVLGPTHEEVITELVAGYVNSYRQLPLCLYQIQTKFRDEYRPRFGLLRVDEFLMKDAYSFHADDASLDQTYGAMYAAYERIFQRCDIPYIAVEAESGAIGGNASHEFMSPCEIGEDVLLISDRGNYAANVERAEIGQRHWTLDSPAVGERWRVHTPGTSTIDAVADFLEVEPRRMLKTLVLATAPGSAPRWLVAVVRGDHEVNPAKLQRAAAVHFGVTGLVMDADVTLRAAWTVGFVGPDAACRNADATMLIDPDAAQPGPWVTGANDVDYHVSNFDWRRDCGAVLDDPARIVVADIRNAQEGDPSPRNDGGMLNASHGIEIGHVFRLGTVFAQKLGAHLLNAAGEAQAMVMGCYGIGIGRILVAAIEASHDQNGIIWPAALAPYSVVITPIKYEGQVKHIADRLHEQLNAAGIDTILDDRDARAGFKFADADLIGFPVRINVGERNLKDGKVELKRRAAEAAQAVELDRIVDAVRSALAT